MKNILSLLCLCILAGSMAPTTGQGLFLPSEVITLLLGIFQTQQKLDVVEKRGCLTGHFQSNICDSDTVDVDCVFDFFNNGELTRVDMPVEFELTFDQKPMVMAMVSGFFATFNQNLTVVARNVTTSGFDVHLKLGGLLPFRVDIAWIACDERTPLSLPPQIPNA